MSSYKIILLAFTIIVISGCSKSNNPPQNSLSGTTISQDLKKNDNDQKLSNNQSNNIITPTADLTTPDSSYFELTSGNQVMFLYYGLMNMPTDYEKIATLYSQDYRGTNDVFKKHDILNALKPRIDSEIQKWKTQRYIKTDIDASMLGHYDFNTKSFPIQIFTNNFYMSDNSTYQYVFSNAESFNKVIVTDEQKAKTIESMVGKYPYMMFRIFAFAQDVNPNNRTVKCQLIKIELLDGHGNLLAVQQ